MKKAGLLKIRLYRPFPAEEIVEVLEGTGAVAVMDRAETFSTTGGPLYADIKSALYDINADVNVVDYIYGLGGRDIKVGEIEKVYEDLSEMAETGKIDNKINYLGVRK